jgi:transposase, IS5 family
MAPLRLDLELSTKGICKWELLDDMRRVVPWAISIALIELHYPTGKTRRPPLSIATMSQTHAVQQWFGLSDPTMDEAFYEVPLYRDSAGLDESMILRFRRLLETHGLAAQIQALVNEILAGRHG